MTVSEHAYAKGLKFARLFKNFCIASCDWFLLTVVGLICSIIVFGMGKSTI